MGNFIPQNFDYIPPNSVVANFKYKAFHNLFVKKTNKAARNNYLL